MNETAWDELKKVIQSSLKNVEKIKLEERERMHNIAFLDGSLYTMNYILDMMERIEND